ncbi:transposase [Mesobacillus harenae]|uniref:transposase n=1 Tax=Mesobacillus harenae TaxID=2213203 RepID=UPI00157FE41E|nr:transposase [Mesobacillus harenae]
MGRKKRVWVPEAYHHIYSRGNNRQVIFRDEIDVAEVFRLLTMIHEKSPISISAFCLMTNHYHFLLKSEKLSISDVMSTFNKRYTDYYNRKYEHIGHLYQQRFNSSPVLYPQDLLYVSRYIHRNPISTKEPLVKRMEDYPYSSYQYYKKTIIPPFPFITTQDLPTNFTSPSEKSLTHYCEYVESEDE